MPNHRNVKRRAHGYTLVEILIVVVILGIAASLIIPSMGSAQVLRVQASMRATVADITFAQSDALAYQERRAIVFDIPNNHYAVIRVTGPVLDPVNDILYDTTRHSGLMEIDFDEPRFGGARLISADFDGDSTLIFDELGGPVQSLTGDVPGLGGTIRIEGADGTAWEITVEPYTGRISVANVTP